MIKVTKAQKVWQKIEADLEGYTLEGLRMFFAAASKFLIHPSQWDDPRPITPYDTYPEIEAFHIGFTQYSRPQMSGAKSARLDESETGVMHLLKQAAGWRGHSIDKVTARKKLEMLRIRMHKRFGDLRNSVDYPYPTKPGRKVKSLKGLRVYESVIRNKYLSTEDQNLSVEPLHKPERIQPGPGGPAQPNAI